MRSSPSQATLKRLFALSGNRCAFPGCGLPIVDPETGNLLGGPIHITATSPGGPRYDPRQTDEEKQDVKNLLLLCHKHHAVIDADPDVYSVDFLRGVKAAHEAYYPRGKEPNDAIAAGLQKSGYANTLTRGSVVLTDGQRGGQAADTIVNIGFPGFGDSLPEGDQLVFRAYDFAARYIGTDSGGGQSQVAKSAAQWIEYWFHLEVFNNRSVNTGLMDIFVVFCKGGETLLRHLPGEHTGEIRADAPYCPTLRSLNLPATEWTSRVLRGALWNENMAAVDGCDEIHLVASLVDGRVYKHPLGNSIDEKA